MLMRFHIPYKEKKRAKNVMLCQDLLLVLLSNRMQMTVLCGQIVLYRSKLCHPLSGFGISWFLTLR